MRYYYYLKKEKEKKKEQRMEIRVIIGFVVR